MAIKTAKKVVLEPELRSFIADAIREILDDPDFGLELSDRARERLDRAPAHKDKTISSSTIKEKYY